MGTPLALITPLNKFGRILLHGRPIIPLSEGLLGQTPFSRVVATNSFVDFLQYIISFIWSEASQVGHGVASSIQLLIEDCVSVGLILYPSCLFLVFGYLSFGQVFQDRVDLASRAIHRHDVVGERAYAGLG